MIVSVVPIKVDSSRLPGKNFLYLGDRPLSHYLLTTLLDSKLFDSIYAFCSDPKLLDFLPEGVEWLPRQPSLDANEVRANQLFRAAVETLADEVEYVFLTQVTSPFLSVDSLRRGVEALTTDNYNSVLSVRKHQTYVWVGNERNPLNYSPGDIPRTQDLSPIYLETSGFYGFRRQAYLSSGTRIHGSVKKIELGFEEGIDIDYPEDFQLAERLLGGRATRDFQKHSFEEPTVGWNSALRRYADFQQIDHVVFDLDGVLVDSLPNMSAAWKHASETLQLEICFELYREKIGLPFEEICHQLGLAPGIVPQLKKLYFGHPAHSDISAYEGAEKALEDFLNDGVAVSIFTSKPESRAKQVIQTLFPSLVTRITLLSPELVASGRGKPAPDGLLELVARSGVDPAATVFVGDMEADRQCAERAGIQFFHAAWGYGSISSGSTASFSSLGNLTDWCLSTRAVQSPQA